MLAVYKFNQKRNGFSLDEENEKRMLMEEIQEFFSAETLAERIDAMIDVRFVFEGTQMKFANAGKPLDADINKLVGEFHKLSTTIVAEELGDNAQYMGKIMSDCWDIVCKANELKGTKLDENGKVIKDEAIPNATEQIAKRLEEYLK